MTNQPCHTNNNTNLRKANCLFHGTALNGFLVCKNDIPPTQIFEGAPYLPCCTTKYIFWLGKNKFDRGGRQAKYSLTCMFRFRTNCKNNLI